MFLRRERALYTYHLFLRGFSLSQTERALARMRKAEEAAEVAREAEERAEREAEEAARKCVLYAEAVTLDMQ